MFGRAQRIEKNPALKAIVQHGAEDLPSSFGRLLRVSLGLRDFYIPDPDQRYTLVDRVRQGAKLLGGSTPLEEAIQVLRFINASLDKGRRHHLIDVETSVLGDDDADLSEPGPPAGDSNGTVRLVREPGAGILLISHPMLTGWFKRSVVLLLSHSENASVGLCINKPLDVTMRDLQLQAKSALSHAKKDEKTVTVNVENYGDIKFSAAMCSETGSFWLPSKRLTSLETTASYRQAMKDAQAEARSLHDSLLKKRLGGAELSVDEQTSLSNVEKFLQLPLTIGDIKVEYKEMHMSEQSGQPKLVSECADEHPEESSLTDQSSVAATPSTEGEKQAASNLLDTRLYNGGPVQSMGALHNISSVSGLPALPGVKFSEAQSFEIWKQHMSVSLTGKERFKMFLGECTWSEGQLSDELKQGCWIMCEATPTELNLLNGTVDCGDQDTERLWSGLLAKLGGEYAAFSKIPRDLPEAL